MIGMRVERDSLPDCQDLVGVQGPGQRWQRRDGHGGVRERDRHPWSGGHARRSVSVAQKVCVDCSECLQRGRWFRFDTQKPDSASIRLACGLPEQSRNQRAGGRLRQSGGSRRGADDVFHLGPGWIRVDRRA
eukprot:2379221-Rhodomonas_salina.1